MAALSKIDEKLFPDFKWCKYLLIYRSAVE